MTGCPKGKECKEMRIWGINWNGKWTREHWRRLAGETLHTNAGKEPWFWFFFEWCSATNFGGIIPDLQQYKWDLKQVLCFQEAYALNVIHQPLCVSVRAHINMRVCVHKNTAVKMRNRKSQYERVMMFGIAPPKGTDLCWIAGLDIFLFSRYWLASSSFPWRHLAAVCSGLLLWHRYLWATV